MTLWNGAVLVLEDGNTTRLYILRFLALRPAPVSDQTICRILNYGTKLAKKVIWYHNSQTNDKVESSEMPQSLAEY